MSAADIIEGVAKVLPAVAQAIAALIQAGKSPGEAAEIVRRDIQSRAAEYEAAKAEDMRRLAEKHATVPANPYDDDAD